MLTGVGGIWAWELLVQVTYKLSSLSEEKDEDQVQQEEDREITCIFSGSSSCPVQYWNQY